MTKQLCHISLQLCSSSWTHRFLLVFSLLGLWATPSRSAGDEGSETPTISIQREGHFFEADWDRQAYLTVTLSAPQQQRVTVEYATINGTARANADYQGIQRTLSFAPGQVEASIAVSIKDDFTCEGNETFQVRLRNPQGATIASGVGLVIIKDDDVSTLTTGAYSLEENDRTVQFQVMLSVPCEREVRASFITRDGLARAGTDYKAMRGQLVFAPGQTSKTFPLTVIDDLATEGDESFSIEWTRIISTATVTALPLASTIFIRDNDPDTFPAIWVENLRVREGNSGQKQAVFVARLTEPTGLPVSINYATFDSNASMYGEARSGSDYIATKGTLVFAPGQTVKRFTVPILGDVTFERDEFLALKFGQPRNANGEFYVSCEILNDDSRDIFQFSSPEYRLRENQSSLNLGLTRTGDNGDDVHLKYQIQGVDVAGESATVGTYSAVFHPGQSEVFISLPLENNNYDQDDTQLTVRLVEISDSSRIGHQKQARVVIEDDDPSPRIIVESDSTNLSEDINYTYIRVSLSEPSVRPVQFDYEYVPKTATAEGTWFSSAPDPPKPPLSVFSASAARRDYATAYTSRKPGDFYRAHGTITIPPGSTSELINIHIILDNRVEPTETLLLKLTNPNNATIERESTEIRIRDDDGAVTTLSIYRAEAPDKMPVGQMFAYGVVVKNTGSYDNSLIVEAIVYLNGREIERRTRHIDWFRAGTEEEVGFLTTISEKGRVNILFRAYSEYEGPPPMLPNLVTARAQSQIYDLLDVTDRLIVYASPLTLKSLEFGWRGVRFRYTGTVTVTCTQSYGANGPLTLVFGGLPDNVELVNRSGTTIRMPRGRPYIKLDLSQFGPDDTLPFDGSITIPVEFMVNFGQKITPHPHILAGTAHP
ncbi:MAG TPA: Calx-beta domain-containing protein [Abditibacteriaceae bacterium]|jgi:hypothetical protein